MAYLTYIEHSAETLQFYLWYLDYTKRFRQLPPSEKSLSPEWRYPHNNKPDPSTSNDIGLWRVKDNTSTEQLFDSAFNAGVVANGLLEKQYQQHGGIYNGAGYGGAGESESSSLRVFECGGEGEMEGDIGLASPAMTSGEFSYQSAGNHQEVTARAFEEVGDAKWMPCEFVPVLGLMFVLVRTQTFALVLGKPVDEPQCSEV
jgi:hypothetical protein